MATKAMRTPSGSPSAKARAKYGNKDGSFPIFDKASAASAVSLAVTGHGSPADRASALRRAKARGVTRANYKQYLKAKSS